CKNHLSSSTSFNTDTTGKQIFMVQVFTAIACSSCSSEPQNSPLALSEKYIEFSNVFDRKEADKLPENRHYDCAIDLLPGMQPPWGPIYSLSIQELETLRKYIEENLEK
ncbi:37133_t:CDS:1, partial [Gigaspora margarita]